MIDSRTLDAWLGEDLGHHDVTNQVPGETDGRLVATEEGTVAAIEAGVAVFEHLGVDARAETQSGERVSPGDVVLRVEGPARAILRGERVAVNVVGHASGIATRTRRAVEAARTESEDVVVAATRKTTPGLRGVEKRAVAAGGGDTHRLDLSGMVMVKDNHVTEMGLEGAIERFRELKSFSTALEAEVERPEDGKRAATAGADVVLFDNLSPEEVRAGVEMLPEGVLSEASGGIGVDDVAAYAATGVDVISMGELTHSAPALDSSFRTGR